MKKILSLILILSIFTTVLTGVGIAASDEPELLYTYDFENDLEGWLLYGLPDGGTVTFTADSKFSGEYSVYIVDNSTSKTCGISSPYFNVTAGEKYTFASMIRPASGGTIRLYIKYYDKDNKLLSNTSYLPRGSYWHPLYAVSVAPENAVKALMQLVGTSTETGTAYVDYVEIYKGVKNYDRVDGPYIAPSQLAPKNASIVSPTGDKLVYKTYNDEGDTLSDFSYAGYYGGDIELPETRNLPVVKELSPTGTEDDTAYIQSAIDEATLMEGALKVVKLKAGKYYLPSAIKIKSGVLLSGEGQGPNGTLLFASTPKQYSPVHIEGTTPIDISARKYYLTDDYVKSGSKTIHVSEEDAMSLSVGEDIAIYYTTTDEWCEAMDMVGVINVYDTDTSWKAGNVNMITERRITAINGTEITVDFGFLVPYITELAPAYFVKMKDTGRVENAGIENLRIESYYNGDPHDEEHGDIAITIRYAKNIFVRDITSKYFYFGLVQANKRTKNITVRNCSCLDPVSTVAGSRRYSFHASYSAQQVLYTGCYSYDARHDYATSREVTGPIAFVDNIADSANTSSETHGTWSTGVLYDNLYQIKNNTKGFIANANRGIYGTALSQGWTSAGCVIWNSLSPAIISHKPPLTYQNFIVGTWGTYTDEFATDMKRVDINAYTSAYRTGSSTTPPEGAFATGDNTSAIGDSYKESVTVPVNPRSLYKAQLSERYTGTYKNARPNAPILVHPSPDKNVISNSVEVSGIYEKGATKVLIYIDNTPYEATLNKGDYTFSLTADLDDGTHKIYATQVIDGSEGNKTADRFITVNEENGNPDYLQSIYSKEETTMLLNDTRVDFSEYMEYLDTEFNPENDAAVSTLTATVPEGEFIKVKNHTGYIAIRGKYSIVATRLPSYPGYRPVEYGMLVSKDKDDFDLETCDETAKAKIALTGTNAYGILFYNLEDGVIYKVRSYAIYKDVKGVEHIMYGRVQPMNAEN